MIGKIMLCLACLFTLSACAANKETAVQLFAMDTIMNMTAYGKNGAKALEEAEMEINRLDSMFSAINKNSEVFSINKNAGSEAITVSSETIALLQRAKEINAETDNAFAITIYPIVDAWGFMKEEKRVPEEAELQALLPLINDKDLILDEINQTVKLQKPSMAIDLGAIAKGYLSDRVSAIMKENAVESAILSLGGNISTIGSKQDGTPWRIVLQDPTSEKEYIGVFSVSDVSIITSGGYQRHFEESGKIYHHILDPKTGYPADNDLLSVTIISNDGTKADGLSTSLFVMGLEKATEFWQNSDDFEAVFITKDKRVLATEGISERFTFESEARGYVYEIISRD